MGERRLELVAVDDLVVAPRNPKSHDLGALGASISRFGYVEPIVVDERTGRIVAGHGRLEDLGARRSAGEEPPDGVAVVDGVWQVPVLRGWASRSDAEAEAYLVASNRIGELGGWDQAALAELLGELATATPEALEGTGYDGESLAALEAAVADARRPELQGDPDEAPPAPKVPRTKPGDLWLAGPHRIYCGDALRASDIEVMALDGAKADAVFTDPPYGVNYTGGTSAKLTIDNDDLDPEQMVEFLRATLGNTRAACRPGAAWYVCGPAGPPSQAFGMVLSELGVWRTTICWVKDSMVLGRGDYHFRHEVISVGEVDPEVANDADLGPASVFYGWVPGAAHRRVANRSQTSVWEFPRPRASREHPTIKPVALVAKAIENSTRANDVVLDPFGGSGSSALAAHSLARRAVLVEKDPRYVDVICRRLRDIAGLEVRHVDGSVWTPVEGSP